VYPGRNSGNAAAILCSLLSLQGCLSDAETASASGSAGNNSVAGLDIGVSGSYGISAKTDSTTLARKTTISRGKRPRQLLTNSAPTISGTPASSVVQDGSYRFVPTASDANGDLLTFRIANRPAWASFDGATGALTGRPGGADVATYSNIVISVSDGQASAQLPAFSIVVEAYSLGSATLSWLPPIENVDGSPLLDLAGYRIYWGQQSRSYANSIRITNPGITTYVIENLSSGTHYFAAVAVNESGVESALSEEAYKLIP